MKTLELNQMEIIDGGSCASASIGLALTFAGAFLISGPIGAGIFAAAFITGSISLGDACNKK